VTGDTAQLTKIERPHLHKNDSLTTSNEESSHDSAEYITKDEKKKTDSVLSLLAILDVVIQHKKKNKI